MKVQIQKEVLYMAIATPIPRYDKTQLLLIEGREIRLIDHLKELRLKNNITKKKISNMIKKNDYWYSQVERSGKNGDDNRQRTIYEPDLINIISIVKYNAQSSTDLVQFEKQSITYLNKIKAVPLKESVKKLEWYELHNGRTPEQQEQLFSSLMEKHSKLLRQAFDNLASNTDKDFFLNCLKNINTSLRIDPVFIIYLTGLPFADFLYETKEEDLHEFIRSIASTLDEFENDDDPKGKSYYFHQLQTLFKQYTGKNYRDIPKKTYKYLPPDEIEF